MTRLTADDVAKKSAKNKAAWGKIPKGAMICTYTPRVRAPGKAVRIPEPRSEIEAMMAQQIKLSGLPVPEEQYKPFLDRKYLVDFCWPSLRVIVEVDGSVHRIKKSFKLAFERNFLLLMADWKVLHVGGDDVRSGRAVQWIEKLLEQGQNK